VHLIVIWGLEIYRKIKNIMKNLLFDDVCTNIFCFLVLQQNPLHVDTNVF